MGQRFPKVVIVIAAVCFNASMVEAGEIIILQSAPPGGQSRVDREADRLKERARQEAGKGGSTETTTIIVGDKQEGTGAGRVREAARETSREAREYLQQENQDHAGDGAVILRATPMRESERLQWKARSYVAPPHSATRKECPPNVGSQVGTIGEGQGAIRGNVHERGTSSVEVQGQCR